MRRIRSPEIKVIIIESSDTEEIIARLYSYIFSLAHSSLLRKHNVSKRSNNKLR